MKLALRLMLLLGVGKVAKRKCDREWRRHNFCLYCGFVHWAAEFGDRP